MVYRACVGTHQHCQSAALLTWRKTCQSTCTRVQGEELCCLNTQQITQQFGRRRARSGGSKVSLVQGSAYSTLTPRPGRSPCRRVAPGGVTAHNSITLMPPSGDRYRLEWCPPLPPAWPSMAITCAARSTLMQPASSFAGGAEGHRQPVVDDGAHPA